jgi:hypothetical protein
MIRAKIFRNGLVGEKLRVVEKRSLINSGFRSCQDNKNFIL